MHRCSDANEKSRLVSVYWARTMAITARWFRTLRRRKYVVAIALSLAAWQMLWAQSTGLNHYFGNLHAHTSFSDGSGTPDEAFEHAADHLDFLAISEHNHAEAERGAGDRTDGLLIATKPQLYEDLKDAADRHNLDGSFVTLWGQEFSTISKGNHSNVFLVDDVLTVGNGDYKALYNQLGNQLLQFNHSWDTKNDKADYGLGQFHGSVPKLAQAAGKNARLIEVINGPGTKNDTGLRATLKGEARYKFYLARGMKLAPTADQDNHYFTWGNLTDARTVVLAPELSRASIVQALKQFRCYASTDKDIRITFSINGRLLGSSFTASSRKLKIGFEIEDSSEPNATYIVQAVYGSPILHDSVKTKKIDDEKGNHEGEFTLETEFDSTFVYLRITQHPMQESKKDMILTAPIWVTVNQ